MRLDKGHRISSIVSVSTEDRFSKRFNRRFSLFLWPQFHDSLPSPAGNGERESPPPERSYRRRKLQASACSCEKGLETAGGVKTTPAFEAEVWKIRYPSSLSRPPRLWNGTLITLMGEPNVNYNSKSKREVIRGRWRSEEDGEGEGEGGGWDRARMDGGKGPDEICLRKKGSPWLVLFN